MRQQLLKKQADINLIDSCAYTSLQHHLKHLGVWWLLTQCRCKLLRLLLYVLNSNFNRRQYHLQFNNVIYAEVSAPLRTTMKQHI